MRVKQQKQIRKFLIEEFGKDKGAALYSEQDKLLEILVKNTVNKSENQMKTLT